MPGSTRLSPEWRDWIIENLAGGCDPQALAEEMARKGFDRAFAAASVQRCGARGFAVEDGAAAGAYVYEAPRLPGGNLIRTHDRDVRVALRLARPALAVLHDVLSAAECAELIRRSADRLTRSTTINPAGGNYQVVADRSSEGTCFVRGADPFVDALERRLAELMGCPLEHGEGLQILHYGVGGEYRPHFDFFPPDEPGGVAAMAKGGQRVASLVMYLNAVEGGGATIFPELGLEVVPQAGSAVHFEYCNSRGQLDRLTLHGGAPVRAGEKWIATKWVRQQRYG